MKPLLALFVRSLRQSTRAPSTYVIRALIGLMILLFLWITYESVRWTGAPGRTFFAFLIAANYLTATLIGLGSFASAVAEEKEEGTIALLRMTELSPLAILFGKSTSRLAIVGLLLVAQVPFTFLAVTLGGVSIWHILTAITLLGSYLVALANVSLFFSVRFQRVSLAGFVTFGCLLLTGVINAVPELIMHWLVHRGGMPPTDPTAEMLSSVSQWMWSVHPLNHAIELAQGKYLSLEIQRSVVVHLSVALGFFLLSWGVFDRYCSTDQASSGRAYSRKKWLNWLRRPSRVRAHAIAWKDFHFTFGGRPSVLLRLFIYGLALLPMSFLDRYTLSRDSVSGMAWGMGWVLFHVEMSLFVLAMWGSEVWGNTLGSLLSTPRSLTRLTLEKVKALLIALIPSVVLLAVAMIVGGQPFLDRTFSRYPFRWPAHLAWVLHFGLFLMILMNFSLRLRWAALPAALAGFGLFEFFLSLSGPVLYRQIFGFNNRTWARIELAVVAIAVLALIWSTRKVLLRRAADN